MVSGRGMSVPDAHVGIRHTNGVPTHRFSRTASADLNRCRRAMGYVAITVTTDMYADEQSTASPCV